MPAAAVVGAAVVGGVAANSAAKKQASAAKKAAGIQAESAADSIEFQRESRDLARSDLQPYRNFGQANLPALQQMLTPEGQMGYLKANPLFQIALDNVNRQSSNAFLGRGKLGDATGQLVNNAYLAGTPLLQAQTNNLFNAANLGQSSAAGQANAALTTGAGVASSLEAAGNARAAGTIGAGNAAAQGLYGVSNAIGQGMGAYAMFNNPGGAVSGGYVPTDYAGQTSGILNNMSYGLT